MKTELESVTYQTVERIQGPLLFLNQIKASYCPLYGWHGSPPY